MSWLHLGHAGLLQLGNLACFAFLSMAAAACSDCQNAVTDLVDVEGTGYMAVDGQVLFDGPPTGGSDGAGGGMIAWKTESADARFLVPGLPDDGGDFDAAELGTSLCFCDPKDGATASCARRACVAPQGTVDVRRNEQTCKHGTCAIDMDVGYELDLQNERISFRATVDLRIQQHLEPVECGYHDPISQWRTPESLGPNPHEPKCDVGQLARLDELRLRAPSLFRAAY